MRLNAQIFIFCKTIWLVCMAGFDLEIFEKNHPNMVVVPIPYVKGISRQTK